MPSRTPEPTGGPSLPSATDNVSEPTAPAQRFAFVTGACSDLGGAIAEELYARGMNVALADLDVVQASRFAKRLGERAMAVEVDVRSRSSFQQAFSLAEREIGPMDTLVNAAARLVEGSFWDVIDEAEWDDVIAANLRSAVFGCQIAGHAMRQRNWGRIVNLSSLAGQRGGLRVGLGYAAAKAGVLVLTKMAAAELSPHGVTVNAVVPGAIRVPSLEALPAERLAAFTNAIAVRRLGEASDVARLVAFLVDVNSGYISGAALDVNGGAFMR